MNNLKNEEDNSKNEDDTKIKDEPNNENNPKTKDGPKNEHNLKLEDKPEIKWKEIKRILNEYLRQLSIGFDQNSINIVNRAA